MKKSTERKIKYLKSLGKIKIPLGKLGLMLEIGRKKLYICPELIYWEKPKFSRIHFDEFGDIWSEGYRNTTFKTFKRIIDKFIEKVKNEI